MNGESAMSGNGAFATLNSASFQASKQVAITAIQRYYSAKYWALNGNAFSEGGQTRNEMGLLLGLAWTINRFLTANIYSDYAYFANHAI